MADTNFLPAFDRLGNKISVPETDVATLQKMGGRLATPDELAEARTQAAYDAQSTATKVATVASMAGPIGYPIHAYLRGQGATLPPSLEAYTQGVSTGMTGGLASVGMQQVVKAAGGEEAARAYGKTAEDVKRAHSGLYSAGEVAGFIGGAVAGGSGLGNAGKVIPGVGIGAVGGLAEQATARVTGGLAARGLAGRAGAAAINLGVRGGVEGALYGAAGQVSEDMLGDHELAADKVFAASGLGALGGMAGGAALGGAGSLAASGAGALASGARGGLARLAARGETAGAKATEALAEASTGAAKTVETAATERAAKTATEAAGEATRAAREVAAATGTKPAQEAASLGSILEGAKSMEAQKGVAYDQAWRSLNSGGLSPTKYVTKAERFLPGGVRDVGETLMRRGVINAEEGVIAAARNGTPAAMVPKIQAEIGVTAQRLGEITEASGARIKIGDIADQIDSVLHPLRKKAGFEGIAGGVQSYGESLMEKLGVARPPPGASVEQIAAHEAAAREGTVSLQDLLSQRKALDELVWREGMPLNPSARVEELRTIRGKLEGLVEKALDDASGRIPGELRGEYKALKRDYMALSIASSVAEDSAARAAKNRAISPTDYLAAMGGVASGHIGAAPVLAIGHKLVRERGNAAAAVLLYRMAEMGTLTKAVQTVDDLVGRAARGALQKPKALPPLEPTPTEALQVRATRAMKRVADIQSNPTAFADHVARATGPMAATAPNVSGALTQRLTSAAAFLAAKVPAKPDRDPFDPHPAPRLTDAQASEFLRYSAYAERPALFFEEVERGKITHEGVETAQALMPRAFAEFQARLLDSMAETMAKGVEIPFRQRQAIGVLINAPAVPSQRPDHMQFLQQNVIGSDKAAKAGAQPSRPFVTKTQPSALDRLEGK